MEEAGTGSRERILGARLPPRKPKELQRIARSIPGSFHSFLSPCSVFDPRVHRSHSTESGVVFSHWIESVTPLESCAHAVTVAVLCASSRVWAAAFRQSLLPRKVMQTRQWNRSVRNVEITMAPITSTENTMAIQTDGFTRATQES
jgi:hypothetical protein